MLQNKADTVGESSLELIKTHIGLAYLSKYKSPVTFVSHIQLLACKQGISLLLQQLKLLISRIPTISSTFCEEGK
jgi:hypothetical protein